MLARHTAPTVGVGPGKLHQGVVRNFGFLRPEKGHFLVRMLGFWGQKFPNLDRFPGFLKAFLAEFCHLSKHAAVRWNTLTKPGPVERTVRKVILRSGSPSTVMVGKRTLSLHTNMAETEGRCDGAAPL
ncbi:hypothetical protein GGX14DRAFT_400393 [Mycena pura]|uniref:Uncharacterized protein n=1 Tax=Mycena pura TaxID=153505 RepID=A0AAD6V223_9AGAR|nr:hypothetical protein GGX14DRAFT_400393 [Mycena pura]